jgi:hypothetical protein
MSLNPHLAVLIVSSSAAGLLMALAGIGKNGLEWRVRRQICPSCGRVRSACVCR